jgi:hypothetical protein
MEDRAEENYSWIVTHGDINKIYIFFAESFRIKRQYVVHTKKVAVVVVLVLVVVLLVVVVIVMIVMALFAYLRWLW